VQRQGMDATTIVVSGQNSGGRRRLSAAESAAEPRPVGAMPGS